MKLPAPHEYVRAADAFDPAATYLAWRPAPDDWQRPRVGDTAPLPRVPPIPRRPPQRVGPDAIDVACIIAGAVLFLGVIGSACALLYVVAMLLGKG